ncbi:MAG TPA: sugar ABC transporter permease [Clostridiales bacterium]|nr:sugar ABC transporter permease [Clostridiales bacterium]
MNHANRNALQPRALARTHRHAQLCAVRRYWDLYLLVLIPFASLIVFNYLPMFGIVIAFQDFKVLDGFTGSKWVGLKHFEALFRSPKFFQVFSNTIIINVLKFVFQFPIPIILALLLNEVRIALIKRGVQTLVYMPHFLSWVVVYGIFYDVLASSGIVNRMLNAMGFESVNFLANERMFRPLIVFSMAWKESGWSTIVYLSAITAIDPQLYEAASVDGAGRLKQVFRITLPCIATTIAFIVIMRASAIVSSDTDQMLMFYRPIVYSVGDILGTYVYREGVLNAKYSYTSAVGLFGSVIGMTMLLATNWMSKRYVGRGIW